jgi:hypothetical protein
MPILLGLRLTVLAAERKENTDVTHVDEVVQHESRLLNKAAFGNYSWISPHAFSYDF